MNFSSSNHPNIELTCPQCPYKTRWDFVITQHLKQHTRRNLSSTFNCSVKIEFNRCKICDFKAKFLVDLFQHVLEEHTLESFPKKTFSCPEEGLIKQEFLDIKPEAVDFPETDYKCSQCGLVTFSEMFLFKHLETCVTTEIKKFACTKCSYKTKRNCRLREHQITKHTFGNDIKWFRCIECSFKTKLKRYLKKHVVNLHIASDKIKWYECQECSYKSKHKGHLIHHQFRHNCDNEEFQCPWCSFKTKFKRNLDKHQVNMHTAVDKIKWSECNECSYKTKTRGNLRMHKITKHTSTDQINWLKCTECSFTTKLKCYLERHKLRTHVKSCETYINGRKVCTLDTDDKIKWLECTLCPYKTKQKYNLKRHQISRHSSINT